MAWITTQQAHELTGYHVKHLRRLLKTGKIVGKKMGRDWFINRQSVLRYAKTAGLSEDKRSGAHVLGKRHGEKGTRAKALAKHREDG